MITMWREMEVKETWTPWTSIQTLCARREQVQVKILFYIKFKPRMFYIQKRFYTREKMKGIRISRLAEIIELRKGLVI